MHIFRDTPLAITYTAISPSEQGAFVRMDISRKHYTYYFPGKTNEAWAAIFGLARLLQYFNQQAQ